MSDKKEKYAVVLTGGKQYLVSAGQKVKVETITGEAGKEISLDQVLLVGQTGGEVSVGTPFLKGANVKAKILAQTKAKKVLIFKKRRRKGYTKKQGHRQNQTELLIESVNA